MPGQPVAAGRGSGYGATGSDKGKEFAMERKFVSGLLRGSVIGAIPSSLLAVCLSAFSLVSASPAGAATIGQLAPGSPANAICGFQDTDIVQAVITSGSSYEVPPFGARITSWSTNASIEANQLYTLKVFRRLAM